MMSRRAVAIVFVLALAVSAAAQQAYVCPMHPSVRGRQGETCRICRMALVPASPGDYRPYGLDVAIAPAAMRPHQPAHVRFLVRDPQTQKPVHDFAVVHERVFHLFVVSRDLDYFAHVHPTLRRSGALDVDVTVPRGGAYQLIADFVPLDGAPQLVQTSFATAGYASRVSEVPELAVDRADKIVDGIRVSLTMPEAVAGREQLITFDLSDAATGAPVDESRALSRRDGPSPARERRSGSGRAQSSGRGTVLRRIGSHGRVSVPVPARIDVSHVGAVPAARQSAHGLVYGTGRRTARVSRRTGTRNRENTKTRKRRRREDDVKKKPERQNERTRTSERSTRTRDREPKNAERRTPNPEPDQHHFTCASPHRDPPRTPMTTT